MIIALQTASGGHLGFILFADDSGDCLIRALPHDPELLESEAYRFLCGCQDAGEFTFRFEGSNDLFIQKDATTLHFSRTSAAERFYLTKSELGIFGFVAKEDQKNG
ncbi:MAG: hypothetical protein PHD76_08890 [Methylacidiphilales bacterium]|nr:hypothetical protein [Candidatus Methylacidiphilales bacterium]